MLWPTEYVYAYQMERSRGYGQAGKPLQREGIGEGERGNNLNVSRTKLARKRFTSLDSIHCVPLKLNSRSAYANIMPRL
jgi:hypothetical protein